MYNVEDKLGLHLFHPVFQIFHMYKVQQRMVLLLYRDAVLISFYLKQPNLIRFRYDLLYIFLLTKFLGFIFGWLDLDNFCWLALYGYNLCRCLSPLNDIL